MTDGPGRSDGRRRARSLGWLAAVNLGLVLLGAGCASAGSRAPSGIEGRTVIRPISPVQRPGQPAERTFETTIAVHRAGDRRLVKTVRSGPRGHFSVALAPGRYSLESAGHARYPSLQPIEVTVEPHRFTRVRIAFDSGMR